MAEELVWTANEVTKVAQGIAEWAVPLADLPKLVAYIVQNERVISRSEETIGKLTAELRDLEVAKEERLVEYEKEMEARRAAMQQELQEERELLEAKNAGLRDEISRCTREMLMEREEALLQADSDLDAVRIDVAALRQVLADLSASAEVRRKELCEIEETIDNWRKEAEELSGGSF